VLNPINTWEDPNAYQQKYLMLASLFIENFKKFKDGCAADVVAAGPVKKDFVSK
jgi:phosphoenolpyruvate carboxykinase (ATP)